VDNSAACLNLFWQWKGFKEKKVPLSKGSMEGNVSYSAVMLWGRQPDNPSLAALLIEQRLNQVVWTNAARTILPDDLLPVLIVERIARGFRNRLTAALREIV